MFDLDDFVGRCREAVREPDPVPAVREAVDAALTDRAAIRSALPAERAELEVLYAGADVTVVKVVWAPRMSFPTHDHLTWACIGMYGGAERNRLYHLADDEPVASGGFELVEGGVGTMDAQAVHSVLNPRRHEFAAAIHVYGGGFVELPRSNWLGDPPVRTPASVEYSQQVFAAANR